METEPHTETAQPHSAPDSGMCRPPAFLPAPEGGIACHASAGLPPSSGMPDCHSGDREPALHGACCRVLPSGSGFRLNHRALRCSALPSRTDALGLLFRFGQPFTTTPNLSPFISDETIFLFSAKKNGPLARTVHGVEKGTAPPHGDMISPPVRLTAWPVM